MEFSLRWLAEYVDLPVGPDGPQQLAKRLTAAGFAVEGVRAVAFPGGSSDDTVIDIDITTNRPDAMNHLGLAREIAVLFDRPLRLPPTAPPEGSERVEDAARIEIDDFAG
ncbi:MAG TPA: phenylalanine--tRNA ligase subunit beta, partial [Thermoanaerobaculia bacterium]|nr:phenylalanine--tRNA ligase subunit beta [Thermoanaerobaculia bacterium]